MSTVISIKKQMLMVAIFAGAALLAGCSGKSQLTTAGSQVQFVDTIPGNNCQLLGKAEGRRSTFFAGSKSNSELIKDAAANLLNNAAQMGGNTIYNARNTTTAILSDLAPTDIVMEGDVYKCAR